MSEQHTNGADGGAKRQKLARSSVNGHLGSILFGPKGETELTLDVRKLPGGAKLDGMLASVVAHGAVNIVHRAANAARDGVDPIDAAEAKWNELVAGKWVPGVSHRDGPMADPLALAVCEYRTAQGYPLSVEDFDTKFVPAFMQKHGVKSVAAAKRIMGMDKNVASIRAKIVAERATAKASQAGARAATIDFTV